MGKMLQNRGMKEMRAGGNTLICHWKHGTFKQFLDFKQNFISSSNPFKIQYIFKNYIPNTGALETACHQVWVCSLQYILL